VTPDRRQAVDATALKHFDFLLEKGFTLDPEPKKKDIWRSIIHTFLYRHINWGIEVTVGYREADYNISIVPLVHDQPREVPFGYRTKWALQDYITRILDLRDQIVSQIKHTWVDVPSVAETYTVEFADKLFSLYAELLATHLDAIVASPHPPISRR